MRQFTLLLFLAILASCNNDDEGGGVITNKFNQIEIILPQGEWEITHFNDDNVDKTMEFENFIFLFKDDGTVEGSTDLHTENGNSNYKSTSENGEQLVFNFNGVNPLDKLNHNWDILSLSVSQVEISVVDNGNQTTKLV